MDSAPVRSAEIYWGESCSDKEEEEGERKKAAATYWQQGVAVWDGWPESFLVNENLLYWISSVEDLKAVKTYFLSQHFSMRYAVLYGHNVQTALVISNEKSVTASISKGSIMETGTYKGRQQQFSEVNPKNFIIEEK